ncbi:hypothetical protein P7K49_020478 [Saguinus oedipus]|uniref:BHLH domain-containing protein n=1 Tax=Saguinus oedipus TaxID=9490 RepID=A0ABQ9V0L6_SAGOE|nr:hypothetical protein P7K49_020478 [Saguinus oedipus]
MKHISAEQKRRFNIKMGFDTLNSLISNNSKLVRELAGCAPCVVLLVAGLLVVGAASSRLPLLQTSHAITLQKTVEYITKLQQERGQMQEEARRLREEIEELNATIISCQQLLPATGVPVTRRQFDHMRDMFDEYVKSRTLQNWKFWIELSLAKATLHSAFQVSARLSRGVVPAWSLPTLPLLYHRLQFSIIIKPLFESFKGMVSTSSLEELNRTALSWLDQHCSLPILRPMVLNTLRQLSTSTSILTDPAQLPEQASEAITRIGKRLGES